MNILRNITFAFLFIIFHTQVVFPKLLMKPYLQAITPNSIIVMVETDTKEPAKVVYGKNELNNVAYTSFFRVAEDRRRQTYVHRIVLENLEPNSVYKYRAIHNKDTSEIFTFRSYVTEGMPFRVGLMGDNRSNPEVHSRKSKKLASHNPYILVYTGDLCYSGKYTEWKKEFFTEEEQKLIATAPFFNALGNHEAQTELTKVFLQAPSSPSNDEYYYSFDYGDVHFLILNTEADVSPNSPQWKFAQEDLAKTNKKWKVVAFHKPAYSAGGYHGSNKKMQEFSESIFEKLGVDLVFNGHNHFYQRSKFNGIYHIVLGGGGSPLYEPKEAQFVEKSVKDYHYAIMDVSSNSIKITVYDLRDNIIDQFEISK
ncbi:MAG: metallophosphoesterase family protein [Ignavibacteria bacterium]|nr:metallophosphoesterase family protein [Ignavibacteria bacterium]